jgi:hypothetical protein
MRRQKSYGASGGNWSEQVDEVQQSGHEYERGRTCVSSTSGYEIDPLIIKITSILFVELPEMDPIHASR